MAISTTFSNIKITNNNIGTGKTTLSTYNYKNNMLLNGNTGNPDSTYIVTGNNFIGATAGQYMVAIYDGNANITGNQFYRGSAAIVGYIYSVEDQVITDNFFDSSTINGTNDALVNVTSSSTFTRNKNQIEYIPITLIDKTVDLRNTNFNEQSILKLGVASGTTFANKTYNYVYFFVGDVSPNSMHFSIDLNSNLPKGITLLECKMGFKGSLQGPFTHVITSGFLLMKLNSQSTVSSNYLNGTNSILDSVNRAGTILEDITDTYNLVTNFISATSIQQYRSVAPVISSNFTNNNNNCINLTVTVQVDYSDAGGGGTWILSPVVAKCIW